jgi:hypothetical protein
VKKLAVPVITAVALTKVQPASVTIQAFAAAGPPLAKLPGSRAAVMVLVPLAPKSAVTDTKSPLTSCEPGRMKIQTSLPGYGPPPWFGSQIWVGNPAAVVGTVPGLMLIVLSAQAGDPTASATPTTAPTRPNRESSDDAILFRFKLLTS